MMVNYEKLIADKLEGHKQCLKLIETISSSEGFEVVYAISHINVELLPEDAENKERLLNTKNPPHMRRAFELAYKHKHILEKRAVFKNLIIDNPDLLTRLISGDLRYAIFENVTFHNVTFEDVNLSNAQIKYSIFDGCRFCNVIFDGSQIDHSYFTESAFIKTSLRNIDSECLTFHYGSYAECDFTDTHTSSMDTIHFAKCMFIECINGPEIPIACPDTGSFIGWKKGILHPQAQMLGTNIGLSCLIKLEIPKDAIRSSSTGTKCRCDKAKVLDIVSLDEREHYSRAYSMFDSNFVYEVGNTVTPQNGFDPNRWNECAGGIHFFINKDEAISY
ncbi:MAG: pentapeptide repeat-containing protein [Clostridiales bacterium]|nr:pentapeptide repeat-containing protein [Clostridiales bacterium]